MQSFAETAQVSSRLAANVSGRRLNPAISHRQQWRLLLIGLISSDIVLTGLAFWLAYVIRFELSLPVFRLLGNSSFPFYQGISLVLIFLWLGVFALNGLYQRRYLLGGTQEYSRVFRAVSIGILTVIVIGFLEPNFILARGWLMLAWILTFLLVSTGRFWLRRLVYALRRRGYFLTPAILIGVNDEACSLVQQLASWQTSGLHLVGFVDDHLALDVPVYHHLRVLGRVVDLQDLIREHSLEEVIVATSAFSRAEIVDIFKRYGFSEGINLRLSSGLFEVVTTGLQVKEMGSVPLVRINQVRMSGLERILKLAIDYAITIPAVVLLLPIFILIALALRLDSPGPIIYRRRVLGLHGREFDAYKFRTMYVNGDEVLSKYPELQAELEQNHKLKVDPRVTRVGRFLRKLSLDELPQFFNVLKRDMSLVGPRIISPEEMPEYDQWDTNLLTVYPGITGLWQINGRSNTSYEERVRLDMYYIRNWTIWLDLQILFQTFPAVLRGEGAY